MKVPLHVKAPPILEEHIREDRRTRPVRSLVKTLTYRFISTIYTVALAWFIFGSLETAGLFGLIDVFLNSALYFGHERLWARIDLRPRKDKA